MRGALVLVAVALGCATATERPEPAASGPSPEIEMLTYDGRVVSERLDRVTLELPFAVQTPFEGTLSIGAVEYALTLEGEPDVHGVAALTEVLEGPGTVNGAFRVAARLPATDEAFARRTMALLPYTVDARIELSGPQGPLAFDAQWRGEVFAPKRPTLRVQPQAARYEEGIDLTVVTTLSNPNGFPLRVKRVPYTVTIEGEIVVERELARLVTLAPRSEMRFDTQHRLDRSSHPVLLKKLKVASGFVYEASAALHLEELTVTLADEGRVGFPR